MLMMVVVAETNDDGPDSPDSACEHRGVGRRAIGAGGVVKRKDGGRMAEEVRPRQEEAHTQEADTIITNQ